MKRKCYFCNETTYRNLCDFHEIKWSAVSFDRKKALCACPKHKGNLDREIANTLRQK